MKRYYITAIVVAFVTLAASIMLYRNLPAQIPTHWNIYGKADDYGAKSWATFLMPVVMFLLIGLFRLLEWLSPKRFQVESFRPTYHFIMLLTVALLAYFHILTLRAALSNSFDVGRAFLAGLFLFLALLGNVLGRVRRNFWIGVRTPWTLASERVWNDTHRLTARLFVVVGILGFLAILAGFPVMVSFFLLITAAIVSVAYSLIDYKRLERRGEV